MQRPAPSSPRRPSQGLLPRTAPASPTSVPIRSVSADSGRQGLRRQSRVPESLPGLRPASVLQVGATLPLLRPCAAVCAPCCSRLFPCARVFPVRGSLHVCSRVSPCVPHACVPMCVPHTCVPVCSPHVCPARALGSAGVCPPSFSLICLGRYCVFYSTP